jgi:hypothetical protein
MNKVKHMVKTMSRMRDVFPSHCCLITPGCSSERLRWSIGQRRTSDPLGAWFAEPVRGLVGVPLLCQLVRTTNTIQSAACCLVQLLFSIVRRGQGPQASQNHGLGLRTGTA